MDEIQLSTENTIRVTDHDDLAKDVTNSTMFRALFKCIISPRGLRNRYKLIHNLYNLRTLQFARYPEYFNHGTNLAAVDPERLGTRPRADVVFGLPAAPRRRCFMKAVATSFAYTHVLRTYRRRRGFAETNRPRPEETHETACKIKRS